MLNGNQLNSIGFSYVLSLLEPCSPYGAELARKPHFYSVSEREELDDEFSRIDTLMKLLVEHRAAFEKTERALMQFKDVRKSIERSAMFTLSDVELFEIKRFLLLLDRLNEAYNELCRDNKPIGIYIRSFPEALDIIDPDGMRAMTFRVSDRTSQELARIRSERHKLDLEIKRADKTDRDRLSAELTLLAAREENEEFAVRAQMSKALSAYAGAIMEVVSSIAKLDYAMAKARLAVKYGCAIPNICENAEHIRMSEMTNPMVAAALRERNGEFTPISVELCMGSTVLTGANMGGKSVTVKTLALNCSLAMAGIAVFARAASLPLISDIDLLSEDREDAMSGLSSFGGEMTALNDIITKEPNGFSLVLLDEFARGTNPHEGAALVRAAVKYFSVREKTFAFITTHFDDVARLADKHYQVMGLRNADTEKLRAALAGGGRNRTRVLEEFMDYGIFELPNDANPPREALTICYALGIDKSFIELTEE